MNLKVQQPKIDQTKLRTVKFYDYPPKLHNERSLERKGILEKRRVRLEPIDNTETKKLAHQKVPSDGGSISIAEVPRSKFSLIPKHSERRLASILKHNNREITEPDHNISINRSIQPSLSKAAPKKPTLFNEKHIEIAPKEDYKRKNFDVEQVTKFNEKYMLSFVEGYNDKLLAKCLDLVNNETDPFLLESNFPGVYIDFLPQKKKMTFGHLLSLNSSLSVTRSSSNGNFQSSLLRDGNNIVSKSIDHSETKFSTKKLSLHLPSKDTISTISSNFSIGSVGIQLPKIDLETFRESLSFYKDYKNIGKFYCMKAIYKNAAMEFGFAELVIEDKKKKSGVLSKYYVPKIYRKMKMAIPISLHFFHFLFKTENIERISIDLLSDCEGLVSDLQVIGFKLEKVRMDNERKYTTYSLKKKDFYDFLNEVLPDFTSNVQQNQ